MSINLTLVGQMIAFFIFVFFCMKFVWPPIIQALKEREKKIADGLAAAELGQQAQLEAEKKADEMLGEAKQQASEVIAQAQKRATQMVDDAKTDAKSEGERIVASAQADIDQQISSAKEQLRKEVSGIAVAAAGKVLKKEVNADNHGDALNELIQQI